MSVVSAKNAIKVIGAGWSRTGTVSLKQNLDNLGCGPCWHAYQFIFNPENLKWLENKFETELIDPNAPYTWNWDELFGDHCSATDVVNYFYWKEISQFYPQCKVILTMRDSQKWLNSMKYALQRTFRPKKFSKDHLIMSMNHHLDSDFSQIHRLLDSMAQYKCDLPGFASIDGNESLYIKTFNKHNEDVINYFESDGELRKRFFIVDLERQDQEVMQQELREFLGVSDVEQSDELSGTYPKLHALDEYNEAIDGMLKERVKSGIMKKLHL